MDINDQKKFFKKLQRLFSTGSVVKNVGKRKLVVKDLDSRQMIGRGRYSKYNRVLSTSGYSDPRTSGWRGSQLVTRRMMFYEYELMDMDPLNSSPLDLYAEETTLEDEEDEVLSIDSNDKNIIDILHNLFYDILNLNFNLCPWVRNTCKYGDFFLALEIEPEYGVIDAFPYSVYEVEREEGFDENNPRAVRFVLSGNTQVTLENYQMIHFRLLSDTNLLPYGKSIFEPARKTWKALQLMEDAMLIYRIMRAPERRVFYVNVGNISPNEIDNFMEKVIAKIKKIPVIDSQTGEYNLRYNLMSIAEDLFLPVRGSEETTKVETLPGGTNSDAIEDVEYLKSKVLSAYKVPKAYIGIEEDLSGKCISLDTKIPLLNGKVKTLNELIKDFNKGIKNYTYSIDLKTQRIVPGEIEWAGETRLDTDVVKITLDNGKSIISTPDHKFIDREGNYVEALKLKPGISLMPLYKKLSCKDEGDYINEYEKIYNPYTNDYEYIHKISDKSVIQNHKVISVELLTEKINTGTLTIKNTHTFAIEAGIFIKNSSLAMEDMRFARTIKRIQKIIISELTKIAIIHLYCQGYKNEDLVNFELSLTNPSTIYEQQKLELLQSKINIASSAKDSAILETDFIYRNIFSFTDDEIEERKKGLIEDKKNTYRLQQIEEEGNDPAITKKAVNTGQETDDDEERVLGFDFDDAEQTELEKIQQTNKDNKNAGKSDFDSKRVLGYKPSLKAMYTPAKIKKHLKDNNHSTNTNNKETKLITEIDRILKQTDLLLANKIIK